MISVISRPVIMDEAFFSFHDVKKLSSGKRCQDVEMGALEAVPSTKLQGTLFRRLVSSPKNSRLLFEVSLKLSTLVWYYSNAQ